MSETSGPLIDPDCRDGKCGSCVGGPCEHECHFVVDETATVTGGRRLPADSGEPTPKFFGHERRECGEHRTVGQRAWCLDCHEWCSQEAPCTRCELPILREELKSVLEHDKVAVQHLNAAEADLTKVLGEIARLRAGEAEDPGHHGTQPTPEQWIRRFNDQTPMGRKYIAEAVLKRANESTGCVENNHKERLAKLQEERDTFLVLLYRAVVEMHPVYANTSFRGQGIGGQAMTPGCLHNNPYTEEEFAWQAELSHTLGQHFEDIQRIKAERDKANPFSEED